MSEYYLVEHGPDGAAAVIVEGLEAVYREILTSMFGAWQDANAEEADAWQTLICDPDEWTPSFDEPFWSFHHSFEDGHLTVQRITDVSAVQTGPATNG